MLEHKTPEKVFDSLKSEGKYEVNFDWKEIFELMKNPDVDEKYKIELGKFNFNHVKEIMAGYDFSEERIESQFEKMREIKEKGKQKTLF